MHLRTLFSLYALLLLNSAATPILEKIGPKFHEPLWLCQPKGEQRHLWITEQAGRIWVLDTKTGKKLPQPFLDISKRTSREGQEEGLLCLAFAPDYLSTGRLYLNLTNKNHETEILRFTVRNPQTNHQCDPTTAETILTIPQPWQNHNGGWLDFGPDGYLYIGMGDGGHANDPNNRAQNLTSLFGKILRIDVSHPRGYTIPPDNPFINHPKAKPEIYALGLRNPWRCTWDTPSNSFLIADVGQNAREEIHRIDIPKLKGANFGWKLREGSIRTPQVGGPRPPNAHDPIHEYPHGMGKKQGLSITGGYLYRGPVKELQGHYFYSDYHNPRLWSLRLSPKGTATDHRDWTQQLITSLTPALKRPSSFATDNKHNLYLIDHQGTIWKFTTKTP